jgi:4-carboxymuconolactone decarboxylase
LVALNCPDELKLHVLRGLANGITKEEIGEILIQLVPYVGFPLAVSAGAAVGDFVERAEVDEASSDGLT